jgi:hypothetical protein
MAIVYMLYMYHRLSNNDNVRILVLMYRDTQI